MRPFYLAAMMGTRVMGALLILSLAYFLSPGAFGTFALVYTNSLLVQMIAGSWLIAIANREMVSEQGLVDSAKISLIVSGAIPVFLFIFVGWVILTLLQPQMVFEIASIGLLSLAFIFYDVTQAIKNAIGQEAAYAGFALYRNSISFVASIGLVFAGAGWLGAVLGLLVGTLSPALLLGSVRLIWVNARPSFSRLVGLKKFGALGISGGLVLALYILLNAPTRNLLALSFGVTISGVWTLSTDLFYGPLAIIGNAYALSRVRLLYLSAKDNDKPALLSGSTAIIEFTLALAVPYALGGYLFADYILLLIAPSDNSEILANVAPAAAILGSVTLLFYSLSSIALAYRRFLLVVLMILSSSLLTFIFALGGRDAEEAIYLSVLGSMISASFWLVWTVWSGLAEWRWREALKLLFIVGLLVLVGSSGLHLFNFGYGWMIAMFLSLSVYFILSVKLYLNGFIEALPDGLRKYCGNQKHEVSRG